MNVDYALGIIEGFYGPIWPWVERNRLMLWASKHGYGHYIYAPKADPYLRKTWFQAHPEEIQSSLQRFCAQCHQHEVLFGVGLSPLSLSDEGLTKDNETKLFNRISQLLDTGIDILALLFDDIKTNPEVALNNQCTIANAVANKWPNLEIILCPTYYSDAQILDKLFGQRPDNYLETLGEKLDSNISVFWTGAAVCSEVYEEDHLTRVSNQLGRKPWLWDNYPVNDGPRMSKRLHIKGFPPRPSYITEHTIGLSVNPLTLPWLTRIPMMMLEKALTQPTPQDRFQAFEQAASILLPNELFEFLRDNLELFHEQGLDAIDKSTRADLLHKIDSISHPAAIEVQDWLQEKTIMGADALTDA